jgi:hypothetical protein
VSHLSQGDRRSTTGFCSCQVCGGPVTQAHRFCSRRCFGLGQRRISEAEVVRIIAARLCGIEWGKIATEVGTSVSTIQRPLRRAQAPVELPPWIRREAADRNSP